MTKFDDILTELEAEILIAWGISFEVYESQDDSLVIHIDTNYTTEKLSDVQQVFGDDGPAPLRIYLNDGEIYENPTYIGEPLRLRLTWADGQVEYRKVYNNRSVDIRHKDSGKDSERPREVLPIAEVGGRSTILIRSFVTELPAIHLDRGEIPEEQEDQDV